MLCFFLQEVTNQKQELAQIMQELSTSGHTVPNQIITARKFQNYLNNIFISMTHTRFSFAAFPKRESQAGKPC